MPNSATTPPVPRGVHTLLASLGGPVANRGAIRFHILTAIHGAGAIACGVMATGSALSAEFRESLAISGGSRIMVDWFGPWVPLFLLLIAAVLVTLSHGSYHLRPWAWPLTLAAYSSGVMGSLWQVSVGIPEGWVRAAINAGEVAYAATPRMRRAYGWAEPG